MSSNQYVLSGQGASPMDRDATKLLYVSSAKYGGDWHSTMHAHPYSELFYVVGGAGHFKLRDRTLAISTDDLVVVNPDVEHTETGNGGHSPLEYIVLGVEGLQFIPGEYDDGRCCVVSFRGDRDHILHGLREMLRELEARRPGYEVICQDLLEVLLVRLMRQTEFSLTPATDRRPRAECALVRRYIDSHFKENVSLDLLAEQAHLNKYYMVHTFSQEYGVSPISYLNRCRVRESKYLLAGTDHSMGQISHMLGFSSPSYFSQVFRRLEGISPKEYRRDTQKGDGGV